MTQLTCLGGNLQAAVILRSRISCKKSRFTQDGRAEDPGVAGYCVMKRSTLRTWQGRGPQGCGLLC